MPFGSNTLCKILCILAVVLAIAALIIAIRNQIYLNDLIQHLQGGGDPSNPPSPPCTFGVC